MMIKDGTGDGGGEASAAAARESGGAGRKAGRRGGAGGGLKKGPWTPAEDAILMEHVRRHGEGNWNAVPRHSGLARCGKSCRLRWANHLRPNLKKGSFSPDEELLILRLHAQLGNKWARMAAQMPGRTDNEIKNYWNTRLKRRQRAGLPIYPPELQEAVRFDRNQQQQHQVQTPPPKQQQQTPAADCRARLTSLRPPPMLDPVGSCPPSGITLPPLPQAPFACQFGFGFPLSPLSPPSNPTSLFQQQLGNYDLNPPPPLSPSFPVKMELPSCQLYPEPTGASGGGDALSHCGLLEALLHDTHVAEEMKIGELLALQAADEQGAKWAQVFCGGYDGSGNGNCREGIKETSQACLLGSAVKSDCLECNMGTKIKSEPPSNASPVKDDISALLNMPAPTMSIIPDSHDTDREFPNGRSLVMMSDEFGLDVQQLASSLSAASAEQDWNISSWPWNNMPGIC